MGTEGYQHTMEQMHMGQMGMGMGHEGQYYGGGARLWTVWWWLHVQ